MTGLVQLGKLLRTQHAARIKVPVKHSFNGEATNLYWKDVVFRVQVPWGDLVRGETPHLGSSGEGVTIALDLDIRGLKELPEQCPDA
jgi:hypothetical protein